MHENIKELNQNKGQIAKLISMSLSCRKAGCTVATCK